MEKTVDARGMACPLPVVNAKNAAEEMHAGDILTVLVDNEIAVQNLQKFANHKGYHVIGERLAENEFAVKMQIISGEMQPVQEAEETVEICLVNLTGLDTVEHVDLRQEGNDTFVTVPGTMKLTLKFK